MISIHCVIHFLNEVHQPFCHWRWNLKFFEKKKKKMIVFIENFVTQGLLFFENRFIIVSIGFSLDSFNDRLSVGIGISPFDV